MIGTSEIPQDVLDFILREVESIPHLEALLILWREPERTYSAEQMAAALYISDTDATKLLSDLSSRRLVRRVSELESGYAFDSSWDASGQLIEKVANVYKARLVQVTTIIHSKSSQAVRDFARAFVFKKDS